MGDLQKLSDAELQAELNKRKDKKRRLEKPCTLQNPNYKSLVTTCQNYIDELYNNQRVDEDMAHYIFEEAMTALFGRDVWDWINSQ